MNIDTVTSLSGAMAAVFTIVSFIPQVLQSYRTRDLSGISLPMYTLFTCGVGMWLIYGLLTDDWPVILANAVTFALAAAVLILKINDSVKR